MTLDCSVSNPLSKQMFHQDEEELYQNWKKSLNNITIYILQAGQLNGEFDDGALSISNYSDRGYYTS